MDFCLALSLRFSFILDSHRCKVQTTLASALWLPDPNLREININLVGKFDWKIFTKILKFMKTLNY